MSATSRGAGVLSSHTNIPPVTKTAMSPNFLQAFDIITQLGGNVLRKDLRVLSRLDILLTIEEPEWDLELTWILNDSHQFFNFIGSQFTGTLIDTDFGLIANQIGETTSNSTNLGQTKHHIALSFHVGVENTQNVLEFRSLHQ